MAAQDTDKMKIWVQIGSSEKSNIKCGCKILVKYQFGCTLVGQKVANIKCWRKILGNSHFGAN